MKYGKAVSLVTNRPEEWTYLPPLVIWFFSRTDMWEYVPVIAIIWTGWKWAMEQDGIGG
jgi:hypothetical protein